MTHDRSGDAKPHACALQSSVAEGRADFEKGGPQARSVTPPRSHLRRTAETAPTKRPNALEDKAWDPEQETMRITGVLTSTANPRIAPHATETMGHDYSSTVRHAVGKTIAQPVSLHTPPIQPGGVMIPPESQDRRTAGCATADAAPSNVGVPKETKNRPSRPDGTANEHGSASAQAVKRGHQVAMIEVPDEEDDTTYQWWLAKGSPLVTPTRPVMTLPHTS